MLASALYQTLDGVFVGQFLGRYGLRGAQSGHAVRHHQFFAGRSDRRRLRRPDLHLPRPEGRAGGKQHLHLRLPDDRRRGHRDRRHPVCGGPAADPPDGRRRGIRRLRGPVPARVRHLLADHDDHFCCRQFSSDLRVYPRQYAPEYFHVRDQRHSGVPLSRRIPLGHLGGSARDLLRYARLRPHRLHPLFPRQGAAAVLPPTLPTAA